MSNAPNNDRPSIALPVIALVSLFMCMPLGLILSIVAFVKYKDKKGTEARTLSIVALAANAVLIPVIGGILAAIAIPNFVMFQCRSKQSEAKGNLKALYVAQEGWRAEHNGYSNDKAAIQFAPFSSGGGANARYEYVIVDASPTAFRAEARGMRDGMTGDLWTIDNTNNLQNATNACRR